MFEAFAGRGGFTVAGNTVGIKTVGFCEIVPWRQQVLKTEWPGVPVYPDIRQMSGKEVSNVSIIAGGPPCQPVSLAGKRGGANDDRFLWDAYIRVISTARPRWVIAENPPGILSMGIDGIISSLGSAGYTPGIYQIPACGVNANHRRDRVWIVAYADRVGELQPCGDFGKRRGWSCNSPQKRSDAQEGITSDTLGSRPGSGLCEREQTGDRWRDLSNRTGAAFERVTSSDRFQQRYQWWDDYRWIKLEEKIYRTKPGICLVDDGASPNPSYQRSLAGDGIVPQVAMPILAAIVAIEEALNYGKDI